MRVLAIIPARGGSKGVPGKNIKILGGKTLINHAIDCAKNSNKVNKIVITTDAEEIAKVAQEEDIQIIKRPKEMANDFSNVTEAVRHVLDSIKEEDYDILVLLQPTAPLRTGRQLDEIISMFELDSDLEGVISVIPTQDVHPARMYNVEMDGTMNSFLKNGETLRRQDLNPVYYRNGCFYAIRKTAFLAQNSFMPNHKKAYVMDSNWLVNIDNQRDFALATVLYNDWKNENSNNGI